MLKRPIPKSLWQSQSLLLTTNTLLQHRASHAVLIKRGRDDSQEGNLTPSSPSWLFVRRIGSGTGRFMSEWI